MLIGYKIKRINWKNQITEHGKKEGYICIRSETSNSGVIFTIQNHKLGKINKGKYFLIETGVKGMTECVSIQEAKFLAQQRYIKFISDNYFETDKDHKYRKLARDIYFEIFKTNKDDLVLFFEDALAPFEYEKYLIRKTIAYISKLITDRMVVYSSQKDLEICIESLYILSTKIKDYRDEEQKMGSNTGVSRRSND